MSTDARVGLLLALADDELILGHRLSEWTGWVPYVEEDLALSSIAQDEIAHARALYELASTLDGRDVDALALGRAPTDYRHAVLCERANRDFAYTIARQWLYDLADDVRLRALDGSTFKELREIAAVLLLEERYHLEHGDVWFRRLAEGPVDARHRLAEALGDCLGEAMALFEPLPDEAELLAAGVLTQSNEALLAQWLDTVCARLEQAGLEQVLEGARATPSAEMIPTSSGELADGVAHDGPLRAPGLERVDGRWVHRGGFAGEGGRRGVHSPDFLPVWEEMTGLYRAHPGASW